MNRNPFAPHSYSPGLISRFSTQENTRSRIQSHSFWDLKTSRMTLLIETDQWIKDEVDAHMNDNICSFQARVDTVNDRSGLPSINSDVELKPGYQYSISSCEVNKPHQIKIVFEFRSRI